MNKIYSVNKEIKPNLSVDEIKSNLIVDEIKPNLTVDKLKSTIIAHVANKEVKAIPIDDELLRESDIFSKIIIEQSLIRNEVDTSDNFGIWEKLPTELYIIGDVHGDYYAFEQCLKLTNCFNIKDNNNLIKWSDKKLILKEGCKKIDITWSGKKDVIIVFAGDVIDRCRNINSVTGCIKTIADEDCDYELLNLILTLDDQAKQYNSRVLLVLGNHEIMNLKNDFNYVSKKGKISRDKVKDIILKSVDNLFGIVRINKYVIVHGGINPLFFTELNEKLKPIEGLTPLKLYGQGESNSFLDPPELIYVFNKKLREDLKNSIYDLANSDITPFWDRNLGKETVNDDYCETIFKDNILKIKNQDIVNNLQIIVAHCPQINKIIDYKINSIKCSGHTIWRIDIAMSRAFDSYKNYELLDIDLKKEFNVNDYYTDGDRKVSILKMFNNSEKIITGVSSIQYFYDTVFKLNCLKYYFLLQDIEEYYEIDNVDLYDIKSSIPLQKIEKLHSLKKSLFEEINLFKLLLCNNNNQLI